MFRYNDVKKLARDVDSKSPRIMRAKWKEAAKFFPLLGLVNVHKIGVDEESRIYTPEKRDYVMGDVVPASCESVAPLVEVAEGEPIRSFTLIHETAYEICKFDCKSKSLAELIAEKELAASKSLYAKLARSFWHGVPRLQQFGLLQHPLVKYIVADPIGANGSNKLRDFTDNQIMSLIRKYGKGMSKIEVVLSEDEYENSMGMLAGSGDSGSCKLRADCILKSLESQENINFKGRIRYNDILDHVPEFDNRNVMIIYDAGELSIGSSSIVWQGSTIRNKTVRAERLLRSSGLEVKKYDSVFVIIFG